MNLKCSIFILSVLLLPACATQEVMKYDKEKELSDIKEYDEKIKVKNIEVEPPVVAEVPVVDAKGKTVTKKKKTPPPVAKKKKSSPIVTDPKLPHQPTIEDGENFIGRRPIKDPFRVGEKTTFAVSYFNIVAGNLTMEVLPFAEVNGEKAYHLRISAKSSDFFNKIYAVDDMAETYLNYENMLPYNLSVKVKESKQLKEIRSFLDWNTLKGSYWEKKVTKEKGEESKKIEWDILAYSQNVISAAFYMRTFAWKPGKKIQFRVADQGDNIVFKGEVVRQEKLKTEVGEFDTLVIKPEFEVKGVFKPVGEILIWLTNDDRKNIVRIESAIKIGTLVLKLRGLEKGQEVTP